jgi:hypothetical protein
MQSTRLWKGEFKLYLPRRLVVLTFFFSRSNQRVLKVLRDVSNQLSLLQKVAAADARGELH